MTPLILFIIAVCLLVYAVKVSQRNKEESAKYQITETPTHFDLLDDNGEKINSSDDRVRPSEAPRIRVVIGSDDDKDVQVQKLRYFCVKDKGYHVTVWPKDNRIGEVLEFAIAGMSYRDDIDDYLGEHIGTLEAEPTNEYDPNAIKILAEDGHHVGYVPKDMTSEVRSSATLPCTCYFYIGENASTYFSDCYIKL